MYNDPSFDFGPVSGTSTASATNGVNVTVPLADFMRTQNINGLRAFVMVAPNAGVTGLTVSITNGTNTVASAALGTATTAGSGVDLPVTAAASLIPSRTAINAVFTGTANAASLNIGTFVIEGF